MKHNLRLYTLPSDEKLLRAENVEVVFPLAKDVVDLIEQMKVAVKDFKGIGLAAPQVGRNLRLAVINLEELGVPPFAIINPKILSKSIKKTILDEGCLSIPKHYIDVKRPAKVEVEAQKEDGSRVVFKASKLFAKVLQHEIDHLNGKLIVDYA